MPQPVSLPDLKEEVSALQENGASVANVPDTKLKL